MWLWQICLHFIPVASYSSCQIAEGRDYSLPSTAIQYQENPLIVDEQIPQLIYIQQV